jgi:hypothetical protein
VPVAPSAAPLVFVRLMWLRVSVAPEGAPWGVPARKTARVVQALRMAAILVKALRLAAILVEAAQAMLTLAMLTRMSAAPTLVPPVVSPSRVVARPAQSTAPLSACRAGP